MELMLFASLLFLSTHLGISSSPLRGRLVAVLGSGGYLFAYSVVALATLIYLIRLYGELPRYDYLWSPSPELYMAAKVIMPVALIFAIGGFLVKNPTSLGMESHLISGDPDLARGMIRITRHPFQWGVVLWAFAHLLANGDSVSVVFFLTFALLGLIGSLLIDRKKAAALGADWEPFAAKTSNLPFLAIVQGRNRLVFSELLMPLLVGLAAYAAIFWGHQWVGGVRIL